MKVTCPGRFSVPFFWYGGGEAQGRLNNAEVFISYAHADNDHPVYESREWERTRGWVECFHDALTRRLKQLRGRETLVWRDQSGQIRGASPLTDTIKDGLRSCSVFLAIVSPAYVASQWCADELQFFREAAEARGGLRVGKLLRAMKINKIPVYGASFLASDPDLADAIGYDFHRRVGGNPLEFDPPHGSELGQAFLLAINALAADVVEALDGPRVAPSGITVYCAESSPDIEDVRGKLRSELLQFGHAVTSAASSARGPQLASQVRAELARARMSLHVLGGSYGEIVPGGTISAAELQYDLAGEQVQRPDFVRLTWLPPGVEPHDDSQSAFIKRVRDSDAQFVTVPLEDVKTLIKDALKPSDAQAARYIAPGDVKIVYLIFEPPDEAHAEPVSEWLFEQGFEVLKPTRSGSLKGHKINLRDSHGAMIFYGNVDDEWLTVKLADLRKTFGQGRDRGRPLKGAVYLADPEDGSKSKFRSRLVDVIPGFGGFRPEVLRGFIGDL